MKNEEFKTNKFIDATVYTLESATSMGSSSIASVSMPMGGVRKRGDNLIAQEGDKDTVPATTPRNFVAKNAKTGGAGAHKDKKKAEKQGDVKHKNKSFDMAEGFQNDESNLWYIYDKESGRLKQRMIQNLDEPKAHSMGYRDSLDGALKVAGIIRSKFDPKKFVQNQGGKWVQVFPYGEQQGVAEGSTDTIYPNAEVIKSRNGKPVGEIYQDAHGWGCFHYKADNGADSIESREEALEWLKDIAEEYRQDRSLREQGVAEGLVGDVVVHNYTKMPMELKPGQAQIHGWGPGDQPIYRVKGHDSKEVITSNKKKMMMIAKGHSVAEGAPIVVMPSPERLKKAEPTKVRYQGDIVTPTKPPSTEKRGVKGRPGQRPMPDQGVAEGKEEKIAQLKKDHDTAVHWSKNETSPQKREAARRKAETIKAHLEKQYKQGVAEEKQRLDPKCWSGKHKEGTKIKGGVRVNNCVPNESMSEDHEIQMASSELESIAKNAVHLLDLVRKYSEQEGLQAWQQSKITKAADYLNAVLQAVSGEQTDLSKSVNESVDSSALIDAVYDALIQNYGDVVRQYGHEAVGDNIIKVVKSYGNSAKGFDEIDMMVHDVMDNLKGFGNDDMEEDHSTMGQGYGIGGYQTAQAEPIQPGAGQNMPVSEDEYMAELFNQLAEKIPKNAPVDVWIKDFEKSNAPQFRGKNMEKRRQMAVAASYGAKNPSKKKKK